MARVVQRRSSPPYAVLVLTGLVVVFLIAAVVLGSYYNTARQDLAKKTLESDAMVRPGDRTEAFSAAIEARKVAGQSLVGYLMAQVDDLQKQKADLTALLSTRTGELEKLGADANNLRSERQAFENERNEAKTTLAQQRLAFETAAAQGANDLKAERDRNTSLSESYDKALAEAQKSLNTRLEEKDRQIADMEAQLRKLQRDTLVTQTKLAEAEGRVRSSKLPADRGPASDGKILNVDAQKSVAYVDVGREDRIHIGTTFAVFDGRSEIKNDTKPKGQVVVKNVMPKTSEVEIIQATRGNPVLAGDIISNVAYDRRGPVMFVVIGSFDFNGDGAEDEHGVEAVQNMIREYGGKITDQISPEVDYVVAGDPPKLPARPSPGSPQSQVQLWQDKSARLDQYRKAIDDAKSFQIPMLNTNRLLVLLGRS